MQCHPRYFQILNMFTEQKEVLLLTIFFLSSSSILSLFATSSNACWCKNIIIIIQVFTCTMAVTGLLIFRGKKRKISRDFQGQIRGKIGGFRGIFAGKSQNSRKNPPISREKSQNSQENRPISRHFSGKSQISKDFQGQIHRKIGRFHGETSPRNNQ